MHLKFFKFKTFSSLNIKVKGLKLLELFTKCIIVYEVYVKLMDLKIIQKAISSPSFIELNFLFLKDCEDLNVSYSTFLRDINFIWNRTNFRLDI